jgi:hypothetical protein
MPVRDPVMVLIRASRHRRRLARAIGVAPAISSIAVLGVGIGTVVRHPAGAVTAVSGVVLLPGLLAPLLGDGQRWLGGASLNGSPKARMPPPTRSAASVRGRRWGGRGLHGGHGPGRGAGAAPPRHLTGSAPYR